MSTITSLKRSTSYATTASAHDKQWPTYADQQQGSAEQDHFISRDGKEYAGTHLLVDFWGARNLTDLELMEAKFRECVQTCGATLLHIHLHHFTFNGGISGVAVLAESHISVHTWPERGYAAFDIFMCGDAQPEKAIPVLRDAFEPTQVTMEEQLRGLVRPELEETATDRSDV